MHRPSIRASSSDDESSSNTECTERPHRICCHLYPSVSSIRHFAAPRLYASAQLLLAFEYDYCNSSYSLYLYHRLKCKWMHPIRFDRLLASTGMIVNGLTAPLNILGFVGPRTFVVLGKHGGRDEAELDQAEAGMDQDDAGRPLELYLHYFTISEDLNAVALSRSQAIFRLPYTPGGSRVLFNGFDKPWYILFRLDDWDIQLHRVVGDDVRDVGTLSNSVKPKCFFCHNEDVYFVTEQQDHQFLLYRYDTSKKELSKVARLDINWPSGSTIQFLSAEQHILIFIDSIVHIYDVTSVPFAPARRMDLKRNQCELAQLCYTAVLFSGNEIVLCVCRRFYDGKPQRSLRVGGLCWITVMQPLALCQLALRAVQVNLSLDIIEQLDHRRENTVEKLAEFLLK